MICLICNDLVIIVVNYDTLSAVLFKLKMKENQKNVLCELSGYSVSSFHHAC